MDFEVGIVDCRGNAGEGKDGRSLHGETCGRDCCCEWEWMKDKNKGNREHELHFVVLTVESLQCVEQDLPIDCEGSEAKLHIISHGTFPSRH